MLPNTYTDAEKQIIANSIKNITHEEALSEFSKLKSIDTYTGRSCVGNRIVDRFTFKERLEVKKFRLPCFYDVYYNREYLKQRPSITRFIDKYGDTMKVWYTISRLYFGSKNIFKPMEAMSIYDKYKPTSVLDPTMGWGGRLVGACALDIPRYIGIDSNLNLEAPYEGLHELMSENSNTEMDLYFQDCLTMDYSKLEYDMVLTSPPYYNTEIYPGTTRKSKQEWDELFYKPFIEMTYGGLQPGGHYCLNIPSILYDNVVCPILGNAHECIEMSNYKRNTTQAYSEYIYVWRKPTEQKRSI